jgi:broad specificity phosphatase PhoE
MRFKEPSTSIYFIRHGKTDFPTDRIYCDDREDPALNKEGQAQAQNTAQALKDVEFDTIFASPAQRTMMTARAIAEGRACDIRTSESLRERRFGLWEGLFFSEIEQQYPEDYLAWKQDKVNYTPEGGETIPDLVQRLQSALDGIIQDNKGEKIAVISHVGPIRMAVTRAFDMPLSMYRQITIDYASITRIDYGKTANNLIYSNRFTYQKPL